MVTNRSSDRLSGGLRHDALHSELTLPYHAYRSPPNHNSKQNHLDSAQQSDSEQQKVLTRFRDTTRQPL